jgi:hypothetical protein
VVDRRNALNKVIWYGPLSYRTRTAIESRGVQVEVYRNGEDREGIRNRSELTDEGNKDPYSANLEESREERWL